MTSFPNGFLWGSATAGHQVEGGNVNADLWPLEWAPGTMFSEPSGDACDHYHRYPEDIALLAGLGMTAYRFSLEWSRIEPEPGYISRAALDHYRRMMTTCLELGVTPVVTFTHFTTPRWFAGAGGWGAKDAADRFGRFAEAAAAHLGDLLGWVATLNEPNVITLLGATGVIPMGSGERGPVADNAVAPDAGPDALPGGVGGFDATSYQMGLVGSDIETMARIHRAGRDAIKSAAPHAQVGWTLALIDLQAAPGGEERCEQARKVAELDWLDVSREDDWVGVQTYSRTMMGPDGKIEPSEGTPVTQVGWEVYPEALGHTVRLAAGHAGVPVIVTENGMATEDDDARHAYTEAALRGLQGCVADGIDVRGYLHWTLLDNFEWMSGFDPKFGLIAVDRTTFERTVKPSARWLGEVARANAI